MKKIGKVLMLLMAVVLMAASFLVVSSGEAGRIWVVKKTWPKGEGDRCRNRAVQARFVSGDNVLFGCCVNEDRAVPSVGTTYVRQGGRLVPVESDCPGCQEFNIWEPPEQETDTPVPSWTPTSTQETDTPVPTLTPTSTEIPPTATSTNTPEPTATPTATTVPTATNTPIPGHPSAGGGANCDRWTGFVQADENYSATWQFEVIKNGNIFFSESGQLAAGERLELGQDWRVNKDGVKIEISWRVVASDGSVAEDNIKKTLNCGKPATPTPPPEIEYPPGAEGFDQIALAGARKETVAGVSLFVLAFAAIAAAIRKS